MTTSTKPIILLTLVALLLTGLSGCKDDDENPCTDAKPFKASFKMGMKVNLEGFTKPERFDTLLVSDTVRNNRPTAFIAEKGYDSYHWTIGDFHENFTTREVSLRIAHPDRIKIQLIAKKKPNLRCFPKDDGIDTVVQYLTVIRVEDYPIIGKYRGHLKSAPNKEFDVEIKHKIGEYEHRLYNINKGCDPEYGSFALAHVETGFRTLFFATDYSFNNIFTLNGCKDPRGIAYMDKSGEKITIKFNTVDKSKKDYFDFKNRVHHTYYGKKIE